MGVAEGNATPVAVGNCTSARDMYRDPVDTVAVQTLFGLCYSLVWMVGVTGNLLVIYTAAYTNISFTVRTVFIFSLACSDLVISFTSLPITAVTIFTRNWIFPHFLCYPIGTIQGSGICISSFTLTAIAVDRYFLIMRPEKVHITYLGALMIVLLIWVSGYVLASPMAIFAQVRGFPGLCGWFCDENWPGQTDSGVTPPARKIYGSAVLAVQFGAPLVICTFCYLSISRKLGRQVRRRQENQVMLPEAERRLLHRRRRTNRMMVAMVVCFALAYFPLNFVNLVRDYNLYGVLIHYDYFMVCFALGHLFAMTSVIWNPFIYGWFNESFRQAIKRLFPVAFKTEADTRVTLQTRNTFGRQE